MEYKNIGYWMVSERSADILYNMYHGTCKGSLKLLGNKLGCYFPSPHASLDEDNLSLDEDSLCASILKTLEEEQSIETDDVQWYCIITDKKKYLLAKLKYGI